MYFVMYMFTLFQAYSALEYTLELMQIALPRAKKHLVDIRMIAYMCNGVCKCHRLIDLHAHAKAYNGGS